MATQTQQIKLPGGQIIQVSGAAGQTITVTPQQLAALQQQQQVKLKTMEPAAQHTLVQATGTSPQPGSMVAIQEQLIRKVISNTAYMSINEMTVNGLNKG